MMSSSMSIDYEATHIHSIPSLSTCGCIPLRPSLSTCGSENIYIAPRGEGIENGCVISVDAIEEYDPSGYGCGGMNTTVTVLYIENGNINRKTFIANMGKGSASHFPCTYVGDLPTFYKNLVIANITNEA